MKALLAQALTGTPAPDLSTDAVIVDAGAALDALANGGVRGKLVLEP